jgi:hypothetical protein
MDRNQVPQELVTKAGEIFETILEKVCHVLIYSSRYLVYANNCWIVGCNIDGIPLPYRDAFALHFCFLIKGKN